MRTPVVEKFPVKTMNRPSDNILMEESKQEKHEAMITFEEDFFNPQNFKKAPEPKQEEDLMFG